MSELLDEINDMIAELDKLILSHEQEVVSLTEEIDNLRGVQDE